MNISNLYKTILIKRPQNYGTPIKQPMQNNTFLNKPHKLCQQMFGRGVHLNMFLWVCAVHVPTCVQENICRPRFNAQYLLPSFTLFVCNRDFTEPGDNCFSNISWPEKLRESSCLCLSSVRIKDINHQAQIFVGAGHPNSAPNPPLA